jgi:ABC-type Fe3+ transport system substrate-binding protein
LENPKLIGALGLADPTRSSSMAVVFENIIQQQMQRRLDELARTQPALSAEAREKIAVREGWIDGMRIIQLLGANAGYFTDNSQRPPIDVAAGDFASGLCIDFYGRQQEEAVERRGHSQRLVYVSPVGGSISSPDTIGLLRGAPHADVAKLFIEYVLSMDGQKLWDFKPGAPGGPERYALRRLPIRKDFYANPEFKAYRSDPDEEPFAEGNLLTYRTAWTGRWFREMAFAIRVMCSDTHDELVRAWKAVSAAGQPADAMAALQDLSAVDYDQIAGTIHRQLTSKDKTDEVKFARALGERFRAQYAKAEELAKRR